MRWVPPLALWWWWGGSWALSSGRGAHAPRRRRARPFNVGETADGVRVVILCGWPGSGKSTLAAALGRLGGIGWTVVCQDELGSRPRCEQAVRRGLAAGRSVVVDRCNHDRTQRSHWTRIAGQILGRGFGGCEVVWLDADLGECERRVMGRTGHKTLPPSPKSQAIVRAFASSFVPPTVAEAGIAAVVRLGPATIDTLGSLEVLARKILDARSFASLALVESGLSTASFPASTRKNPPRPEGS